MPCFNSINLYQNRPEIKLVLPKNTQLSSAEDSTPDPRNSPPPHYRFLVSAWLRPCFIATISVRDIINIAANGIMVNGVKL